MIMTTLCKERKAAKENTATLPIFLCWFAYTAAYLGRYSYAANVTEIMEYFNVNHADAGLATTLFFFAYGIGQVVNGILCKYYNKRLVIPAALIISTIINFCVFLRLPFTYIKYLWLINGVAQSVLWPTLIFSLSENLRSKDLPKSVIAMSTSFLTGTVFSYGASALMSLIDKFEYTFLLAASFMLIPAFLWSALYKKAFRGNDEVKEPEEKQETKGKNKMDFPLVIMLSMLALFAIANNLIKDGLSVWVPSILKESFGLPDSLSIFLTLLLPVVGIFGAMLNSALKSKIRSFVDVSGVWFFLSSCLIGVVVLVINTNMWYIVLAAFILVYLTMCGVNNIITSMAPLYLRDKVNSGMVAGVLNGFCYVGSTISSYGLGIIADNFGWNGVFKLLLVVSIYPVIFTLLSKLLTKNKTNKGVSL